MATSHVHTDDRVHTADDHRRWHTSLLSEARADHGGLSLSASFVGSLVAIAMIGLLSAVMGALASNYAYDIYAASDTTDGQLAGAIAGLAVLFVAFFVGGWTAGRSARYSGLANGAAVVAWTLLIALVFGVLGLLIGEDTGLLSGQLPSWLTEWTTSTQAVISALIGLTVMLVGSIMGAWRGTHYHAVIDREIAAGPEDLELEKT